MARIGSAFIYAMGAILVVTASPYYEPDEKMEDLMKGQRVQMPSQIHEHMVALFQISQKNQVQTELNGIADYMETMMNETLSSMQDCKNDSSCDIKHEYCHVFNMSNMLMKCLPKGKGGKLCVMKKISVEMAAVGQCAENLVCTPFRDYAVSKDGAGNIYGECNHVNYVPFTLLSTGKDYDEYLPKVVLNYKKEMETYWREKMYKWAGSMNGPRKYYSMHPSGSMMPKPDRPMEMWKQMMMMRSMMKNMPKKNTVLINMDGKVATFGQRPMGPMMGPMMNGMPGGMGNGMGSYPGNYQGPTYGGGMSNGYNPGVSTYGGGRNNGYNQGGMPGGMGSGRNGPHGGPFYGNNVGDIMGDDQHGDGMYSGSGDDMYSGSGDDMYSGSGDDMYSGSGDDMYSSSGDDMYSGSGSGKDNEGDDSETEITEVKTPSGKPVS